jgi:hypothetical protein
MKSLIAKLLLAFLMVATMAGCAATGDVTADAPAQPELYAQ